MSASRPRRRLLTRVRPTPEARPDDTLRVLGFPAPRVSRAAGARRVLRWLNERLGTPYVEIGSVLYAADLSNPLPAIRPSVPVAVVRAEPEDLPALAAMRFPSSRRRAARKETEFRERLSGGDVCIVARRDADPVAYVWVTYRDWRDPDLDFLIRVRGDECLGYEAYTTPPFRRRGLRQLLHLQERLVGRESGKTRLLFELHGVAAPLALATWEAAGFRQRAVARHTTRRLFGKVKITSVEKL